MIWNIFVQYPNNTLPLCLANHRPGYWSNLPCDWPSTAWAYSVQETENGPWFGHSGAGTSAGTVMTMLGPIITLRPRQNGRHFPADIFKCIFFNENLWISIKSTLKFVPKVLINNIPALVLIMAWRCSGDKLLSESMLASLLTHICVTRPQWVMYGTGSWRVMILDH